MGIVGDIDPVLNMMRLTLSANAAIVATMQTNPNAASTVRSPSTIVERMTLRREEPPFANKVSALLAHDSVDVMAPGFR